MQSAVGVPESLIKFREASVNELVSAQAVMEGLVKKE
jgi:hypothetical protein